MKRRLAAVLATDVVGYSRLIRQDEAATLQALKAHRDELFKPRILHHGGRLVKLMGDGLLAEFPSAVEAVRCAVEIQYLCRELCAVPEEKRILYRAGINIGDIVVEDDDIYGDGVNVAARLEGLADPGGVCISRNVFDQVKDKLDLTFDYLGDREVKNISEPVTVYGVKIDEKAAALTTSVTTTASKAVKARWPIVATAVTGCLVILWALASWEPWVSETAPVQSQSDALFDKPAVVAPSFETFGDKDQQLEPSALTPNSVSADAALPLPEKPSIVVLPFDNMSADPEQQYFVDGMTEDLITDLSKISGLFVIARNSAFIYKNRSVDTKQVAKELGVKYVLEGSVRRIGNQVRINAQLVDAETGGHLWADRYDGSLADVFGLQDKVTRRIVAVLAPKLTKEEKAEDARRETLIPEAYDAFLRGWNEYVKQTPIGFQNAVEHYETAVDLDPNYSRTYAALAAVYWEVYRRNWHTNFGLLTGNEARVKAEDLLSKAQRDPTSLSHQVAASMLSQQGRHTDALAEGNRALDADPNDPNNYVVLAGAFSLAGNPEEALRLVEKAMRLNPHFPPFYLYTLGLAEFCLGNFEAAADALEKAVNINPDDRWSYRLLLATYGHLGRVKDAEAIQEIASRNWRGHDPLTLRAILYWYPFMEIVDQERLAEGLRAANVPD